MSELECPECAAPLSTTDTVVGEIIDCDDCGVELEVVTINPIQLAIAPDVGEDWGE